MTSDDNDPRRNRDRDRSDDNPFIAFRRFADSQASALLNTVFTLPATIANYRNAHVAREQCLFGRADAEQCQRLHEMEQEAAKVVDEIRDLYRAGNLEEALDRSAYLAQLSHATDTVRKQIVEGGRYPWPSPNRSHQQRIQDYENELVEKTANEKGQQWGWSWDWGFPKPFDAEDQSSRSGRCRPWRRRRQDGEPAPAATHEEKPVGLPDTSLSPEERLRRFLEESEDPIAQLQELFSHFHIHKIGAIAVADGDQDGEPHDSIPIYFRHSFATDLDCPGVQRDAFEDLMRCKSGLPLMPREQLGQSDHFPHESWVRRFWDRTDRSFVGQPLSDGPYPKRVPWEGEETAEEPNYEYSHDHEDQHDEPPSPKTKQAPWSSDMPETESEAYERLLGPMSTPGLPAQDQGRPSILSTLTTTEKTIGPDGTVTTKVVLKKRFSDGREESSETVHTQRGHQSEVPRSERVLDKLEAAAQDKMQEQNGKGSDKKTGWFWSN